MDANKFRELDTAELTGRSGETQEQLFRLRFQIGMGQTDGIKRYRELRKDRARMLSVMRERELGSAGGRENASDKPAGKRKGK
jgi:large subunit ribosomal protein L29